MNVPHKMFNKEDDAGLVGILRQLREEVEVAPGPVSGQTHHLAISIFHNCPVTFSKEDGEGGCIAI